MTTTFAPLRIGGTGYITGIRISPDGNTRLIKTDTYGGYWWDSSYVNAFDGAVGRWTNTNLIGSYAPSSADTDPTYNWGCGEIAVAPSNSSICYAFFGAPDFLKSSNGGATWTLCTATSLTGNQGANAQSGRRFVGPQMAIHPTDPTKVYLYTQDTGLWYSSDSGASFTQVSSVTLPGTVGGLPGEGSVVIAPNGTTVYATSAGHGLFKATSVGGTFTQVTGGPGTSYSFFQIACSTTNKLFLSGDGWQSLNSWWRYDGTTWVDLSITSGSFSQTQSIFCDPNNANRAFIGGNGGGALYCYTDADATTPSTFTSSSIPFSRQSTATGEGPWPNPAISSEGYMSEGSFQFDPVTANRLWFAEGIGVWYADIGSGAPSSIVWNFQSRGIEQLVANKITATPNGTVIGCGWDRALFAWNASSPNAYSQQEIIDQNTSINHCWHVDWASANPDFLVAYVDNTGASSANYGPCYSTNAGVTWTSFMSPSNTTPAINQINGFGGTIVAANTQKILWQTQWNADLYYSANQGSTWTKQDLTAFGVPLNNGTAGNIGTNETGWGTGSAFGGIRHHVVCADRATTGLFWAFNTGSLADASYSGVYKLDATGTPTWSHVRTGTFNGWDRDKFNPWFQSVPKLTSINTTGHLFYTSGQSGGANPDTSVLFWFSVDGGGATWNSLANVAEVYAFGFGAARTGKDYPTVFFNGYVFTGGVWVWGIYKIEANFADWQANSVTYTFLAAYPANWTDEIRTMDGDKLIQGRLYMGFAGSGFMFGDDGTGGAATPAFGFSVITDSGQRRTKMIGY